MKKENFKSIRTEIRKVLKENFEDQDDFGSFEGDFDEFEFHTNAKDAAKSDIEDEFGEESFEDIGNNEFEKGKTEKDFAKNVAQANLNLPSDEKELNKIQAGIEGKENSEKELKGVADKYGFDASFSLNEIKRKQILAGIITENFDKDDNFTKLAGDPEDNGVTKEPIEALGIMENETEESGDDLEFQNDEE